MADINLESKTPVAIGATDAAIVRRGSGTYSAELVTLGDAAAKNTGTTAGTVAAGDHTHSAATTGAAGFMSASDKSKLDGIAAGAQVNVATDLSYTAATRLLASSTGTDVTLPLVGTDAGLMSAADKTKLDGIATGATANSSDATLLNRANHTGTQLASTISDFSEAVDDRVSALLVAGANVTLTYNDGANTLTIAATSGGTGAFDYGKSLVMGRRQFLS